MQGVLETPSDSLVEVSRRATGDAARRRQWFVAGALGYLLAVPAIILFAGSGLPFGLGAIFSTGVFGSVASAIVVLLSVSLFFQSAGFYGIWKDSRSTVSAMCFPFGIAISIMFFVISGSLFAIGASLLFVLVAVSVFLLGFLFVLQGITYVVLKEGTKRPPLNMVAGGLFIVGGLLLCSLYLQVVGDLLLAIPLAIGSLIMVRRS